jgi:UPF0176 protein
MTSTDLTNIGSNISKFDPEKGKRTTISFYRYVRISDPVLLRNQLYQIFEKLNCLGRIYVSSEGLNAQMSLPTSNLDNFRVRLQSFEYFSGIHIRHAIDDKDDSFKKLVIKTRNKLVHDGLNNESYDFTNTGRHISALEFHEMVDNPDIILVDMRNHYESEIGHFRGAILPQTDTFRETIKVVAEELQEQKNKKVLLYCTGGIRCEKASAYLKHEGFKDVSQLLGGIVEYAAQVRVNKLESKFIGKNFVFDERLGERITKHVIGTCYQCGKECDSHTNCSNNSCHLLFIQCEDCSVKFSACCSQSCYNVISDKINEDIKPIFQKSRVEKYRKGIKRTNSLLIKSTL